MRFLGFLTRRIIGIAAVMVGVSIITFAISHVIPADPVAAALGDHANRPSRSKRFRAEYHLARPSSRAVPDVRDWPRAWRSRGAFVQPDPSLTTFSIRSPATIELSLAALLVATRRRHSGGGVFPVFRGRLPDHLVRLLSLIGGSVPVFWLGLIVSGLFYYQLGWLPGGARIDTFVTPPPTRTGPVRRRQPDRRATSRLCAAASFTSSCPRSPSLLLDGGDRADDAIEHARGARSGLHATRTRQSPSGTARDLAPRIT